MEKKLIKRVYPEGFEKEIIYRVNDCDTYMLNTDNGVNIWRILTDDGWALCSEKQKLLLNDYVSGEEVG